MMSDGRRRLLILGLLAVLTIAVALISATALTGPENALHTRVFGSILATLALAVGIVSLALTLRSAMRQALTGLGARMKEQTKYILEDHDRRQADLVEQLNLVEEHSREMLEKFEHDARELRAVVDSLRERDEETSKALGSLARSFRQQTDGIATIRKQSRSGVDAMDRLSNVTGEARGLALESRDNSRKLLNVVRADTKANRAAVTGHSQDLQALTTRLEEIERAQRRLINFLRREGNIQFVLDRMQASERRLLNSVESSALTTSGELSRAVDQAHSGLREWLRAEVLDGGALRSELRTISHGSQALGVLVETLDTKTNEIAGQMEALASVMDRVRAENSKSFESLGDVTSRAADSSASTMQEVSLLHEEFRPLFKERADSQQAVEGLVTSIRSDLNDLVDRWDALQEEWNGAKTDSTDHDGVDTSAAAELRSLVRLTDVLKNDVKALHRHVDRAGIETVRQTEALMQLLPRVNAETRRLPASGGFAMTPDSLLLLSDLIELHRPEQILELGSGTSTIWLGSFAKNIGASVLSIDHLEEYRARTQEDLNEFGLTDAVELRLAELSPLEVGEVTVSWYNTKALQDLSRIDLVVVDGPPESTGPDPRNPAFPVLRSKLADHALIVVDDIHREQEQQMVSEWLELDGDLRRTNWSSSRTLVLEYRRASNLA